MATALISILLAVGSACSVGVANFFGGLASRRAGAMSVVIWMQLIGVPPAAALAAVTTSTHSLAMAGYGMAIGAMAAAGLVCFYRALSFGAMAIAAPLVGAIGAVIPVLIGLATGDRLHILQGVGLAAAALAIVIVGFQGYASISGRGLVMTTTAGVFLGINFLAIKAGSPGGAWTAVWARCTVAMLVTLAALATGATTAPVRSAWALVAATGLLETLAFILLLFAYRGGTLSITSVLAGLHPAVTVVMGWVVLRERLRHSQKVGVALALVAIGLVGAG